MGIRVSLPVLKQGLPRMRQYMNMIANIHKMNQMIMIFITCLIKDLEQNALIGRIGPHKSWKQKQVETKFVPKFSQTATPLL